MKPTAIVYTSNTGHTEQYARMLGRRTGLSVFDMCESAKQLTRGTPVLYLGWLHASHVKGFQSAVKRFSVCAVCGVGLCDNGTMVDEVRKATLIPAQTPLFILQGGIDRSKLKGLNMLLISMLTRGLASNKKRSEQEDRMLELLKKDASYVCEENLAEIIEWYEKTEQ